MKTKNLVFIAIMTAILNTCKFILSFIPNVEVVTLIFVTASLVFGIKKMLPVSILFCTIEGLLYGFNPNILCYYIHWSVLVLGCSLFKNSNNKELYGVFYILVMTALFGVQTSATAVIISGGFNNFFAKFSLMYVSGILFYVIHILSNVIIFLILYSPLAKIFNKIRHSYFNI